MGKLLVNDRLRYVDIELHWYCIFIHPAILSKIKSKYLKNMESSCVLAESQYNTVPDGSYSKRNPLDKSWKIPDRR